MKDKDGKNKLMHGYGPVAKTSMRNGLLDQLCLWVHPVLAGEATLAFWHINRGTTLAATGESLVPGRS